MCLHNFRYFSDKEILFIFVEWNAIPCHSKIWNPGSIINMVVTPAWIFPAEKVKSAQQANVDAH